MHWFLILAAAAVPAFSQLPTFIPIDTYLGLTEEQSRNIQKNNEDLQSWMQEKTLDIFRIRAEVAIETARSQPDPIAIGQRYVQIEATCRQGSERMDETRRANEGLLTLQQKSKLAVLREVLQLIPTIAGAQQMQLLEGPALSPFGSVGINPFPILGASLFPSTLIACPNWPIVITSVGIPGGGPHVPTSNSRTE